MAAIWGMEKFHFYLYGKEFLLQMDQKPLTSIFKKHLVDVSPRVWRITIPGKDNAIADTLSRVSPTPVNLIKSEIELPIHQVNIIKATMEEEDVHELQQETASDPELQAMAKAISNGWPTLRKQAHPILHDYWNYRDELSIDNGILTKNQKIIIPKTLQQKYLDRIHSGHQGIQQSLQKMHEYIFLVNYTKHMPGELSNIEREKVQVHQHSASTSMAYTRHQPLLLQKTRFSHTHRLLFKVPHSPHTKPTRLQMQS